MSTIMKALQRLEAQKQARKPSSLQEEITLRPAQSGKAPGAMALRVVAGVVVLVCVAASVWFFGLRKKESTVKGVASQQVVAESSAKPAPMAANPTPPSFPEAAAMPTVEKNSFLENSDAANATVQPPSAKPTTPPFDRAEIRIPPKSVDASRAAAPSFRSALKAAAPASAAKAAAPQPSAKNSTQNAPPQSPLVALIERKRESEAKSVEAAPKADAAAPTEAPVLEAPQVAVEDSLPATDPGTSAEANAEASPRAETTPTEAPAPETPKSGDALTESTIGTQTPPATAVEPAASAAAVLPAPQTASPSAAATPEPTPKSDSLATPVVKIENAGIPEFRIRRTIWHPQPERRIAVIELLATKEMINLTEGDVLGPLAVKEIKPSRVVFLHGEVEVTRRVGELP